MRAIIMFLVTVLIASSMAPVIGTAIYGVLTGTPLLVVSQDLAGVPFLYYGFRYALPTVVPFALGVSLAAAVFAYLVGRDRPFWFWATFFSALGVLFGLACASSIVVACINDHAFALAGGWIISSSFSGAGGMFALSFLWFYFGKTDASNPFKAERDAHLPL